MSLTPGKKIMAVRLAVRVGLDRSNFGFNPSPLNRSLNHAVESCDQHMFKRVLNSPREGRPSDMHPCITRESETCPLLHHSSSSTSTVRDGGS